MGPTDTNVLITGESGTGKELVAHAIHQASDRRTRLLIRVNCAAIPRELFESEFFGHAKGAFTGALRDRVGRFELADGGTIFLDEVGEERARAVNVRLIAATNRDLKDEVVAGKSREDLYFRLNVFPIECQPLRERPSDIPILADHFLDVCCARLNLPKPALTKANIKSLIDYPWPGNARELQNVVERAAILMRQGKLTFDLPRVEGRPEPEPLSQTVSLPAHDRILTMAELERSNIRRALEACGGKVSGKSGAATLLGIKPTTLYSRINAMNR
ncbi:sigma-54 dependent transcriptional regulator [Breoghania sp.]|uniref:sigma-54 interaction domain-containing protein n=1 Tax=Breoghania sp. TaxID=2065378 RepID=UPI0032047CC3